MGPFMGGIKDLYGMIMDAAVSPRGSEPLRVEGAETHRPDLSGKLEECC